MVNINNKGLLLYFSSRDVFYKMTNEELGDFIRKELMWGSGDADEPNFDDEIIKFCAHSRLKEQAQLRDYNRRKKVESRNRQSIERPTNTVQDDEPETMDIHLVAEPEPEPEVITAPDSDEFKRWLSAIYNDGAGGKTGQEIFNEFWNRYFDDRDKAKEYVKEYCKQNKKHITLF